MINVFFVHGEQANHGVHEDASIEEVPVEDGVHGEDDQGDAEDHDGPNLLV